MASIEFIEKRIAGKEKEIDTLNKKLSRIRKAESTNWEVNPYYYGPSDLRQTLRDIEKAETALAQYQSQLVAEQEKLGSRNIQVILDFLAEWKRKVMEYYSAGLLEYYSDLEEIHKLVHKLSSLSYESSEYSEVEAELQERRVEFREATRGVFEEISPNSPGYSRWNHTRKVENGKYEWLKDYTNQPTYQEAVAALDKLLTRECELKYDDMIERTNAIVGQITDASNLSVGNKGELNGYVIGTRGCAKIETIGAGGYNIQVFHYRTLIKPIKNPNALITI